MGTIELPKKNASHQPKNTGIDDIAGIPDMLIFDRQQMATVLLAQETDRLMEHLDARLPKEVMADGRDSLREKLHNCLDEIFQKVFFRYLETSDGKSLLDNIERDRVNIFSLHSPKEVAGLLCSGDGSQRFNSGEIEKSLLSQASAISDLEALAESILRQRTDADVFLGEDNVCTVVACAFRDNALKPKTVTDLKLCISVADSDLIDPFFRYHAVVRYLIRDLACLHLIAAIDKEIEAIGEPEDIEIPVFADRIVERGSKTDTAAFEIINIRHSVRKNAEIESVCTQGFGKAVSFLAAILNVLNLKYQFMEYEQNGHKATIREYEDSDDPSLPDERYQITLRFLDESQLAEECKSYDLQFRDIEKKVQHLWDLIEVIYQDSKHVFKVNDFEDLAKKNKSRIQHLIKDRAGDPQYESIDRDWDDISIVRHGKEAIRARLTRMRERITNMYEFLYPVERRVMEERLSRLEKEYACFEHMVNPYLLQAGLVMDVDITSIKQKKTTLNSIAVVLEDFLCNVSRGFQLAAIDTFGRDTFTLPGKVLQRR